MQILKFSAAWCNACKALDSMLEPYKHLYTEVDIDTEQGTETANKYGIRGNLPVVVVVKNGQVVKKLSGLMPMCEYEKVFEGIE